MVLKLLVCLRHIAPVLLKNQPLCRVKLVMKPNITLPKRIPAHAAESIDPISGFTARGKRASFVCAARGDISRDLLSVVAKMIHACQEKGYCST